MGTAPAVPTLRASALAWLWLALGVVVLDQATKLAALAWLEPYVPHPVIPGLLNWTLAFNTGAAFSFLADAGGWQRWGFSALATVVTVAMGIWLRRTPRADWRTALPLALLIGGAVGNLIDRLHAGQVTDFIQVYHQDWAFPAFNVADSAITVGAALLALFGLFTEHARRHG